jgi:hypothetical protein
VKDSTAERDLTLGEAASRLGVHGHTIRKLHRDGFLAGREVDGQLIIPEEAIERCRLRLAAEQGRIEGVVAIDRVLRDFADTISEYHHCSVLAEVRLTSLEADARSLEQLGDTARANALRDLIANLRQLRYAWDATARVWTATLGDETCEAGRLVVPAGVH